MERTKIIKSSSILWMLISLFFLGGCNKDEKKSRLLPSGSKYELPIEFMKSLTGSEIKTYRILVFSNGHLVSDADFSNTQNDAPATKVKVEKGFNNFYVFCNETAELRAKIDNISRESDLENIIFTSPVAGANTETPMYGKIIGAELNYAKDGLNVRVNGITKTYLTIPVDRLMTKLSITFIKNIDLSDDFIIDQLKITIHRMPKNTTVKQGIPYTAAEWQQALSLIGSGTLINNGTYTVDAGSYSLAPWIDHITFRDIYIPEHILSDPSDKEHACYLSVEATYHMKSGDSTQQQTAYIIHLGQEPPANYNLSRNNHIDIYATIRKLGEGLTASFQLAPWNDGGNIDVEEPDGMYFLNLSKAYVQHPILYFDKDRKAFVKDDNGNYLELPDYNYSCLFWTNRPASTLSTTDFIMEEDPYKALNITQSMFVTEDNSTGNTYDVSGRVDIHIPANEIAAGLSKTYSMRLEADKVDRKLSFTVPSYDLIPEILDPGFYNLKEIVITNYGSNNASTTTESVELSICLPKDCELVYNVISPNTGYIRCIFTDITPAGTDPLLPRKYRLDYTTTRPKSVTLAEYEIVFSIRTIRGYKLIYTSPFSLKFWIKKA